jgi:hypothetical protein
MMFRTALALIVMAGPAFAQHGGSFGSRGFAGHVSVSGHPGFSQPNSFARSGQPIRYSALGGAGSQRNRPLSYSGLRIPYSGNRFLANRSSLYSRNAGLSRSSDRERDPFRARRRSFENWYARTYPNWPGYGYPYVIDPGFYDWGDPDNSAYDQGGALPLYPAPYSDEGYGPPSQQPATAGSTSPSTSSLEQFLTVIFKSDRAPVKVLNYMMTAKVLTDLDSQHYEQIPMDQIDLAATQRVNSAVGVEFQIPSASRD